jgi:hypothetical protein
MTFSKLKPAGYIRGDQITPAQINQLNDDLPYAIDGRGGGTYAPTAAINISNGNFEASAGGRLNGTFTGNPTFNGTVTLSGTLSGTMGGTPTLTGNAIFSGNPSFTGYPSFSSVPILGPQLALFPVPTVPLYTIGWGFDYGVLRLGQGINASTSHAVIEIPAKKGTLKSVNVNLSGNAFGAGPHSALPANKVRLELFETDGNANTSLGSAVDPSTSVGAYDVYHAVTLSVNFAPVSYDRVLLLITAEHGANSINTSVGIQAISAVWEIATMIP